jgi:hypothetical protein
MSEFKDFQINGVNVTLESFASGGYLVTSDENTCA